MSTAPQYHFSVVKKHNVVLECQHNTVLVKCLLWPSVYEIRVKIKNAPYLFREFPSYIYAF